MTSDPVAKARALLADFKRDELKVHDGEALDAAFIRNARELLAELADEVERLRRFAQHAMTCKVNRCPPHLPDDLPLHCTCGYESW